MTNITPPKLSAFMRNAGFKPVNRRASCATFLDKSMSWVREDCFIEVWPNDDILSIYIACVWVAEVNRQKRVSTRALKTLCTHADAMRIDLDLVVNAYDDISEESLRRFFFRLGFRSHHGQADWMTRRAK